MVNNLRHFYKCTTGLSSVVNLLIRIRKLFHPNTSYPGVKPLSCFRKVDFQSIDENPGIEIKESPSTDSTTFD
jgi:hypothetical protein